MADEQRAGPSEAYHVLGQLNEGMEESRAELKKLRDQADQTHRELMEQLAEAQQTGDEASLERLPPLIEQAQQAWIVANEELGDDEQDDQPPTQEDDDNDPESGTDSSLPAE